MDVAVTSIFLALYTWGAHWRHLANTTEPSVLLKYETYNVQQ